MTKPPAGCRGLAFNRSVGGHPALHATTAHEAAPEGIVKLLLDTDCPAVKVWLTFCDSLLTSAPELL